MRALTLLCLMMMTVPSASAGWFSDVTIDVRAEHAGDRLSYSLRSTSDDPEAKPWDSGAIIVVEGTSRALDAYGIERDTVSYRIDTLFDGVLSRALRCHRLADGDDLVRQDLLGGERGSESTATESGALFGTTETTVNNSFVTSFRGSCPHPGVGSRVLREGERLAFAELLDEEIPPKLAPILSQPAAAVSYHGRDALVFVFDFADLLEVLGAEDEVTGEIRFTLADGLPGVVLQELNGVEDGTTMSRTLALVGFEAGSGPATPTGAATLPVQNPGARFTVPDGLDLDDAAFDLDFTYADALAALRQDARSQFDAWTSANPDALLSTAYYTATTDGSSVPMWTLCFVAEADTKAYAISQETAFSSPLVPLRPVAPVPFVTEADPSCAGMSVAPPPLADSAALAAATAAQGVAPGSIMSLSYELSPFEGAAPFLQVSQVGFDPSGAEDGLRVQLDPSTGAVLQRRARRRHAHLDAGAPPACARRGRDRGAAEERGRGPRGTDAAQWGPRRRGGPRPPRPPREARPPAALLAPAPRLAPRQPRPRAPLRAHPRGAGHPPRGARGLRRHR